MTLSADSSEFADLVCRWLDETATADEAALLWSCVSKCQDCANEFAAAARFEAMLDETVRARNVEAEARQQLATTPRLAKTELIRKPAAPRQQSMKWLALAAALVVLGLITAMLWPEATMVAPKIAQEAVTPAVPPTLPRPQFAPVAANNPQPKVDLPVSPAGSSEVPLTDRLDRFFLTGVSLNQVPLSQAIGQLQGQLRQTDYEKTLDLAKLRVVIPAGATARRVTFYSGAMPFLKAVRAVAALAGCDVQVSELTITLTMQSGIYPHLAEKRTLSDMLAGRLNADGTAMVEDAARLAGLWEDAMTLGIAVNEDGTAALSRGQWEALRMMSDARDQVGLIPVPAFAMYVVPAASVPQNRALTPEELAAFQQSIVAQGAQPITTFTPQIVGANNMDPLALSPNGEEIELTLQTGGVDNQIQNSGPQQTTFQGGGITRIVTGSMSMQIMSSTGAMMTLSADRAAMLGITSNVAGGATSVVVVPVTPPP